MVNETQRQKIPKIYFEKINKNGQIEMIEFPRGVEGRKLWDKLLLKSKGRLKI